MSGIFARNRVERLLADLVLINLQMRNPTFLGQGVDHLFFGNETQFDCGHINRLRIVVRFIPHLGNLIVAEQFGFIQQEIEQSAIARSAWAVATTRTPQSTTKFRRLTAANGNWIFTFGTCGRS